MFLSGVDSLDDFSGEIGSRGMSKLELNTCSTDWFGLKFDFGSRRKFGFSFSFDSDLGVREKVKVRSWNIDADLAGFG